MAQFFVFYFFFFFFNDTATTEIYTLSLHDALPITRTFPRRRVREGPARCEGGWGDRKSTRLNSSHGYISYAVFCLKKKNNHRNGPQAPQEKHAGNRRDDRNTQA